MSKKCPRNAQNHIISQGSWGCGVGEQHQLQELNVAEEAVKQAAVKARQFEKVRARSCLKRNSNSMRLQSLYELRTSSRLIDSQRGLPNKS